jgi:hypothetical protein
MPARIEDSDTSFEKFQKASAPRNDPRGGLAFLLEENLLDFLGQTY